MIGFTTTYREASSTVDHRCNLTDAPRLHYSGGSLLPDALHVLYVLDSATGEWKHTAKVSGRRYLTSGSLGRSRVTQTFWHEDPQMPQWIEDYVAQQAPASKWVTS